jgi:hypothetical protein
LHYQSVIITSSICHSERKQLLNNSGSYPRKNETKNAWQDEQRDKEYVAKRKAERYDIYERERKQFNNIEGNFYDKENDECVVRYTTDLYNGVNCEKEYKGIDSLILECRLGIFTKRSSLDFRLSIRSKRCAISVVRRNHIFVI